MFIPHLPFHSVISILKCGWSVSVSLKTSDKVVNNFNHFLLQLQNECLALVKVRAQNRVFPFTSIKFCVIWGLQNFPRCLVILGFSLSVGRDYTVKRKKKKKIMLHSLFSECHLAVLFHCCGGTDEILTLPVSWNITEIQLNSCAWCKILFSWRKQKLKNS